MGRVVRGGLLGVALLITTSCGGSATLLNAHNALDRAAVVQMQQRDLTGCRETLAAEDEIDRLDALVYAIDIASVRPC